MEFIGAIGMIISIMLLIYLCYKGMNGFIASLLAAMVVIVTSGLPFWETFNGTYAATMGSAVTSYIFFFCTASAFGELMKISGTAEVISNWLFKLFGSKGAVIATLIITFLLAYSGINAFVIIFVLYPIAVPMFKKANISKNLLPAIFLYGSVILNVATPGNPSALNVALSNALGTSSFSAPIMGIVILLVAFVFGMAYLLFESGKMTANGEGFVASGSDMELLAGDVSGKQLPPLLNSLLPIIAVIVLKFVLANFMSSTNSICTSILLGTVVLIVFNYSFLKDKLLKGFTDGWWSSINSLILTAGLLGFAAVVNSSESFQYFVNFSMLLADKLNPYLSSVICINIFSGITGASLSGVQIFCNTLMDNYLTLGINVEAMHKILSLAAMGLDTLPHCPTFIMMASICGVSTKASYKHVMVLTVLTPIALALIGVALALVGIV